MRIQLGKVIKEYSKRNKNNNSFKVFSVTNSSGFIPSTEYFSKEVFSKDLSNYKIVKQGMIAYNPSRINVGSVACQNKAENVIVSPLYIVFSVDASVILPEILELFLKSNIAQKQIKSLTSGSVRDSLKYSALERIEINIPPLNIQKEILGVFSKLSILIDQRKQQLNKINQLAKSRFIEMFGDVVNNSKNLEISTLGRECVIVSGGTPSTGNEEYWNGNIKWITPAEIDEIDYIIFDTVRHITDKGKSAAHLELMPKGTVLLSSRAPIGKLAITGSEMTCNQGFKNLIPKDRITPIFLYYYLKGIIPEIQSLGRGATFKEVSKSIVANIKILVPSKREQIAFNSFIEQLDKSKFRIKKSLEKLELTYKALLQEYFG